MAAEERKFDVELDKQIQKLLDEKKYVYGGLNPNTMYEMVKLFLIGGEYNISSQTMDRVNSIETLKKFHDIFDKTTDVVNCICVRVSEGHFDEFEKICSKLGVSKDFLKELVKQLKELYARENREVDEWNNSYEARRYADYEDAARNLCYEDHVFRKSLNILEPYVEDTYEMIDGHLMSRDSEIENVDYKKMSVEDARGFARAGKLDAALAACEAHDTSKGDWAELYAEILARMSEKD